MSTDPSADRPGHLPRDRLWRPDPTAGHGAGPSSYGWGRRDAGGTLIRPAAMGKRVGAYVIDLMTLVLVVVLLAQLGLDGGLVPATPAGADQRSIYISGIAFAVLTLAYFVLMEAATGQTLGKRTLRIRATMADGSDMTVRAALTRRLLFVVGPLIPVVGNLLGWFAVPLAALVTAVQEPTMHQGFHDRWARTRVVDA